MLRMTFIPSASKQPTVKRECATNDPRAITINGKVAFTHKSEKVKATVRTLQGRVAYLADVRGFHNVALPTAYRGSLTADGMAVSALDTTNRLEPLSRTVALSDTYVSADGESITDVRFARGAVRQDDGDVDSVATLEVAKLNHAKR